VKKWIIVGVTIAVLWSLAGVVAYMSLRHKSSQPEMVASMEQLPGGGSPWGAEWSPDGQTILYASSGIRIVDADGMNERYLGEGSEGSCPTWSPDGSKIAFESDNGLEVMNADGSGKRLLASLAEIVPPLSALRVLNPITWSPDGGMIAFELQADFPDPSLGQPNTLLAQIWTVNADGSNLKRLTTDSALEFVPSWSPDSQTIAFVSDRNDGISEIWTSHVDGSDLRQLTEGWGPRGGHVGAPTEPR
jgi:Tol biopolymer transport system component